MVQFSLSENITSFRFSAKNNIIVLPKAVEKMSQEDQEIIKKFTILVRELYIKKVVQFSTESIGKKICAIQLRHSSINEAIHQFQESLTPEVFNPVYSQFQYLSQTVRSSRNNPVMEKPKAKSSTALDLIEDFKL